MSEQENKPDQQHADRVADSQQDLNRNTTVQGAHAPAAEPSGPRGDNPSTAGPGKTDVHSSTPENSAGHINPSPEDANATPGTLVQK